MSKLLETLEQKTALAKNIIGVKGLEMLPPFKKEFDEAIYYDEKKGFSQQPRWKEFSVLAERLSQHIKNSLKQHAE